MIKGFTDPACPLGTHCPEVVAANVRLLAAFRERGLPVFFTTVIYRSPEQAAVFRRRIPALNVLTPDSHWIEVDTALTPQAGEALIEKQWASGFFGTGLAAQMRAAAADSVVVTGLTTSGCVRATALDAMQHDFPTVVVREAVGDRNPAAHEANLFDLNAKYADVWTLDDTLASLKRHDRAL